MLSELLKTILLPFVYALRLLFFVFRSIYGLIFSGSGGLRPRLLVIIFIIVFLGSIAAPNNWNRAADFISGETGLTAPHFWNLPYRFGLDIRGGTHLVYKADLSAIPTKEQDEAMTSLRDVVERRVNAFGVAEPTIQIEESGDSSRLIVELAGITDVNAAIRMIGDTPFLEFREPRSPEEQVLLPANWPPFEKEFKPTNLTGSQLKRAVVDFDPNTFEPIVSVEFNDEGKELFREMTAKYVGAQIAIFLDGWPISAPTVREEIPNGQAVISGNFKLDEAKELVRRLNAGALPVPVTLISQETIGAILGQKAIADSFKAGLWGLAAIVVYMIFYYRLLGVVAVAALFVYALIILALFKLVPVTLTLAGVAGVLMSFGMAVDANILIFERMKEEFRAGRSFSGATDEGFRRAWSAIWDSNITTIVTAVILFWLGTGAVKGFALTLMIGVAVSMFTAIYVSRTFLGMFVGTRAEKWRKIWGV